jgi:peptidoglycan/LPS O-acetylase OafA/YrhL
VQPKDNNYFPELTGVRAIAASMVFVHHFNPASEKTFGKVFVGMSNQLAIGVTLFFVLSGFLIANRYLELKDFDFRRYFLFRVARIYPMYFLLTTATVVVLFYPNFNLGIYEKIVYFLNISFLRGFSDDLKFTIVGQGWSLTVEETFYLLAPLLFLVIRKKWQFIFVFPFIFYFIGREITSWFVIHPFWGFFKSQQFTNLYTFFGRSFEFFIGIGLAILLKKHPEKIATKSPKGIFTYTGLAMMVVSLYLLYITYDNSVQANADKVYFALTNNILTPVISIVPFYYGLLTEDTKVASLLRSKTFVLLGKASYVFYLIHMGIFRHILPGFSNIWVKTISDFIILQLISIALFSFIEEPINNYIRKKVNAYTRKVPAK